MRSLKRIIVNRLQWLAVLMVALILPVAIYLQVLALQSQARDNAAAAFQQIRQILEENTQELENVKTEYRETCLHSAESIAYMIQHHPEILGDIEEFRMIARMMEVDEIHVFDQTGRIFTGTHPEYYDYTFETGEQIGFFAPLLEDKSLRLCQDVTPNTAEGKLVQYSALWSADGEFIVQVGMYPATILEYTKKNELSYIFSLLQGSPGMDLYAIDGQTGIIQGATSGSDNGKSMEQIGLRMEDLHAYKDGTHVKVNGVDSFCVFTDMDGTLIAYVMAEDTLYNSMVLYTLLLAVSLALIVFIIVVLMWNFTRSYIVKGIEQVNQSLSAVAAGDLDQRVEVRTSLEFSELSDHINDMVHSILAGTDKMSFVLDHTNLRIGVYEYSTKMKTVRFTEHIPDILGWDGKMTAQLASDYSLLQQYFASILGHPVTGEKKVFRLDGPKEVYIKLEEVVNGADTLGIVMDVTEDILTRRRIEQERDIDLLTGLFNRRAMERQMAAVFQQDMGHGALVVVDSDSLKYINDVYGHSVGDRYLQLMAQNLNAVGTEKHLAARQGGDEFLLLLYGYASEAGVLKDMEELRYIQKTAELPMEDGSRIPIRFSFGYVLTHGRKDYATMVSEADGHMYNVKRIRKQALRDDEE